jgi:EpsD family peptidyl-prolyl cis-trans isomerase
MMSSGCSSSSPAGQIVATIDGEDVTKRDILGEYQANGLPVDATIQVRDEIVERVIQRKLLAAAARRKAIDRTPEYLSAVRRSREVLLADALSKSLIADEGSPSEAQIGALIDSRPWMFARHEVFVIDHLRPDKPDSGTTVPKGAASLDAVAAALAAQGRRYHRSRISVDSDDFSGQDAERLAGARPGEPIRLGASFVAVIFRTPAPVDGAAAREKAAEALRRLAIARKTEFLLAQERKSAVIRYQTGYGPSSGNNGSSDSRRF